MVRGRKEGSKKEERSIGWVRVKYLEISKGWQGKDGMVERGWRVQYPRRPQEMRKTGGVWTEGRKRTMIKRAESKTCDWGRRAQEEIKRRQNGSYKGGEQEKIDPGPEGGDPSGRMRRTGAVKCAWWRDKDGKKTTGERMKGGDAEEKKANGREKRTKA